MRVEDKNYYELLGVAKDASVEEIKRAYRDMSRIFHPDSNFYSDLIQDKVSDKHLMVFKLLTLAYNTLTSDESRKRYDDSLLSGVLKDWEEFDIMDAPPYHATQFNSKASANQAMSTKPKATSSQFGATASDPQLEPLVDSNTFTPMSEIIRKKGFWYRLRRLLVGKRR